jgi:hypothetical protein
VWNGYPWKACTQGSILSFIPFDTLRDRFPHLAFRLPSHPVFPCPPYPSLPSPNTRSGLLIKRCFLHVFGEGLGRGGKGGGGREGRDGARWIGENGEGNGLSRPTRRMDPPPAIPSCPSPVDDSLGCALPSPNTCSGLLIKRCFSHVFGEGLGRGGGGVGRDAKIFRIRTAV